MKKVKLCLAALITALSLSVPVYGAIEVPEDVKKMDPVEAFKKGFEAGVKSVKETNDDTKPGDKSEKDGILNKPIDCKEFEITIKEVKIEKNILKLTYDYKNTSEKTTSPWMAGVFDAFQEGVELDDVSLDLDSTSKFMKSVQKGGKVKDLVRAFKMDTDTREFSFEIGGFFDMDKTKLEYTVK